MTAENLLLWIARRRRWLAAAALLVIAWAAAPAGAEIILATDSNALVHGTVGPLAALNFTATIDYAVYAPGQFPGADPSGGTRYVYAYEIFNGATSTGSIKILTVGLDKLDDSEVMNAGNVANGGVAPYISAFVTPLPYTSVKWSFADIPTGSGKVAPGGKSEVLLFTSPFAPRWDVGTLQSNTSAVQTPEGTLPSPVPEPGAAMLLSVAGAIGILLRGVRRGVRRS